MLLDLNLPGMDGLDVAREIRRRGDVPIIMVTARVEETDRLIGLELGADDYILKPYSPRELVARVRAVLRRAGHPQSVCAHFQEGDLEVDLEAHTVLRGGQAVELTPTEFNLLAALIAQPGRVFSRLQLLEAAQGTAYEGYERTVDAHIKNLRAKLEIDPKEPQFIETVFGVGYRFQEECELKNAHPTQPAVKVDPFFCPGGRGDGRQCGRGIPVDLRARCANLHVWRRDGRS